MKEKPFDVRLWKSRVSTFLDKNQITFEPCVYLFEALTHKSFSNEHGCESNERLEFLGDAILNALISKMLFEKYLFEAEGFLSRERSKLVNNKNLAKKAKKMGFDKVILLGKGEKKSGSQVKESIMASAYEAFIGALHQTGCVAYPKHLLDLGGTNG